MTDYSNTFFDFAYLRKPIIYTHFDYKDYRHDQFDESYFNYKKHGFGPICYNLNCTIKNIIWHLENGCLIKKKYLKRIKKFFQYSDANNCKRIYLSLLNNSYININRYKNKNLNEIIFLIVISIKLININKKK